MRFFLFLFFFSVHLLASDVLVLKQNTLPTTTLGYTDYTVTQKKLTPKEVYNSNLLKKADKLDFENINGIVWTKLRIKNGFKTYKTFVLYNPRAGMNYIDAYLYKNGHFLEHHLLGDMNPQNKRKLLTRESAFALQLAPGEEVTIVTRLQNYSMYTIGWHIEPIIEFFQKEHYITMILFLFGGFLIVYVVMNIVFYIIFKETAYIILAGIVLGIIIYTYTVDGYLYSFNTPIPLPLITTISWITPLLIIICFMLFPYFFFNTQKKYPKIAKALLGWIFLFVVFFFATLYMLYTDHAFFKYYKYIALAYIFMPFFVFGLAIYFLVKKEPFAIFYFFGQIVLTLFNIIHTIEIFGLTPMNFYTPLILPLGISWDALFLFFIVYKKSQVFIQIQRTQKELLMEQLRYISIGQAIEGVVHQWKTPIAHLGNIVTMLESSLRFNKNNAFEQMEKYIPECSFMVEHMAKTSDELLGQYHIKNELISFKPKETIENNILKILSAKATLKNLTVHYEIDPALSLTMNMNTFVNIMMILIDNTLDASHNHAEIFINIEETDKSYVIHYKDKSGGIEITPIEKIFDYQFTTKQEGQGIGMSILKMLITDKLKGDIRVKNLKSGVHFTIKIPR
jgi:two-component system, sensor histidine kinase LadS